MAIIKKIATGKGEVIKEDCKNLTFLKGTCFSLDGKGWIVSEEMYNDNTDFRKITSTDNGDEEIRTLKMLVEEYLDGKLKLT